MNLTEFLYLALGLIFGINIGLLISKRVLEKQIRKQAALVVADNIVWMKDYCDAFPNATIDQVVRHYGAELKQRKNRS